MLTRRWSRAALAVLLAASGVLACGEPDAGGGSAAGNAGGVSAEPPSGAKPAPTDAFLTVDGDEVRFADLRGQTVIANLWGTWCLPCRDELPELVQLARTYEDRSVVVLGIAVESGTPAEIREFLEEFGVEYPNWVIGMDVAVGTFGAVAFPTTLILDREGWIRRELVGPQTEHSLTEEIAALLP